MAMLKSERHHWWPECVSQFWKNSEGSTHWLLPNGEVRKAPPKNFGVIGNGHYIKLGQNANKATVWDQSFETEFNRADSNFPETIKWLEGLDRESCLGMPIGGSRLLKQNAPDDKISFLVEGLVSLAVRSPMNREAAVGLAEKLRGPLPERERNTIISMNMRNCQRKVTDWIGTHGKFVVIYSPDREFIFGDGFFHNITSPSHTPSNPKILAPLTPHMSVLFTRPMQYTTNPKLLTLVVSANETDILNQAVQVYAKNAIFYRSEPPAVMEEYRRGQHLQYSDPDNPIDNFIHHIPGVPPQDKSLDLLFARSVRLNGDSSESE